MADKFKGSSPKATEKHKRAERWFDSINDAEPFDAFGSNENKQKIGAEIFHNIQRNIRPVPFYRSVIFKFAAAILVFLGLGAWVTIFIINYRAEQNKITWVMFNSAPGRIDKLTLSDSTEVYLRPGARLRAPEIFKGHLRQVQLLEGEAFFEVKHNALHPFIVQTANLNTQVLGTSFLIKNYQKLKSIKVSVATGRVAVLNGKKLLSFLTPRQELTYFMPAGKYETETLTTDLADQWKNGEYLFNNATLQELALELENVYGIKVHLRSAGLQRLTITTQFNMKDSMQNVLEQLRLIHHVRYVINNKEVTLMK